MKIPKLVIFDMDGVLVNSESCFKKSCAEALERWGVTPAYEEFTPYTGMGDILYIGGVSEAHGVPYTPEMTEVAYDLYEQYAAEYLQVFPWSKGVLEALHGMGVKICVASSAGLRKVKINLSRIGIDIDLLSTVVTGSDVERKKPAPDIFLTAAEKSGEHPEDCLVIEDALSGIAAAKAAGMRVATVVTSFSEEELCAAGSDFICHDLWDIIPHYFGSMKEKI